MHATYTAKKDIDKIAIQEKTKVSVQDKRYLSESLNLPSIIAGICWMGLISEDEFRGNYSNYLEN